MGVIKFDAAERSRILEFLTTQGNFPREAAQETLDLAIHATNEVWTQIATIAARGSHEYIQAQVVLLAAQFLEQACRGFSQSVVEDPTLSVLEVNR